MMISLFQRQQINQAADSNKSEKNSQHGSEMQDGDVDDNKS